MDRIDAYLLFVRVAESGSFKRAAQKQQISAGTASKRLAALEARLGVTLFHRTTRAVTLTEDGSALFEKIRPLLAEFFELETSISKKSMQPAGRLRLSAPQDWGRLTLLPALARFSELWPQIDIQCSLNDRMVDLVGEGFDLAIRIGNLENSSMIGKNLGEMKMVVCASPDFLKKHETPNEPQDLRHLPCIIDTNKPQAFAWQFQQNHQQQTVRIKGRLQVNGAAAACMMAAEGAGVVYTPEFACQDLLASGQLQTLLPHWTTQTRAIWALYPSSRYLNRQARLLIDHLNKTLKTNPARYQGIRP